MGLIIGTIIYTYLAIIYGSVIISLVLEFYDLHKK